MCGSSTLHGGGCLLNMPQQDTSFILNGVFIQGVGEAVESKSTMISQGKCPCEKKQGGNKEETKHGALKPRGKQSAGHESGT